MVLKKTGKNAYHNNDITLEKIGNLEVEVTN